MGTCGGLCLSEGMSSDLAIKSMSIGVKDCWVLTGKEGIESLCAKVMGRMR